jgi:hypothetical protein
MLLPTTPLILLLATTFNGVLAEEQAKDAASATNPFSKFRIGLAGHQSQQARSLSNHRAFKRATALTSKL